VKDLIHSKELTHIVHLYGRFLRKTSSSKPAENTVSQLRWLRVFINARAFLRIEMNAHVDASNGMVQLDERDYVTVNKGDIG
jgi:hypothetical protein